MNKIKFLSGMCLAAMLSACSESEVTVDYKLSSPVTLELYTESYYTTLDLKGEEKIGTITATYADVNYSSKGDTTFVKRNYVIDKSRGYLKNFMPTELAWRIKEVNLSAVDRSVTNLTGIDDGYDTLLAHIPMPSRWRDQLLNPEFKPHLKRLEKHRWEMDHLLKGVVPVKGNVTELLKQQGRLNFALIKIDSVVTKGFTNRDHRKCLDYVVYLQESESFPYFIWEQHVGSKIVPEKFKGYTAGHKGEYRTEFEVMIEPETGLPCQEREVKVGTHTMIHPETKDSVTFTSHVTYERLYNIKREVAEPAE
jgi:hypothetical protein